MKQRNRLSILLLAFFVVSFCLFASPAKASAATEGYYTYTVYDGKAIITAVSTSISGAITIPSTLGGYPVICIDSYAFEYCDSLTSVTIGNSVTCIGYNAFYYCYSLAGIYVDDANPYYSSDEYGVLFNKDKSELIQAPGGLLGSYRIPDSVTSISNVAFSNCKSLTSVTIGNSVTAISEYAFAWCTSLTSVTIGNSVTSIGDNAFYSCESLTSVTIPDSVTSIEYSAFSNCTSLAGIYVDDANPNYSSDEYGVLFNKNKSELIQAPGGLLGSYSIPDSVTSIGSYAFSNCTSLTSATIPDSVTSIGRGAFASCNSLTSVTIPDSVTAISNYAFTWCTSLSSVIIPDSVTSIGEAAFDSCTSLTSVTYCGTEDQWNQISIGSYNTYLTSATRYYHNWNEAVCETDKVCTICGEVDGQWHHSYDNGTCTACGQLESASWTLTKDAVVDIALSEDLYIDLNGFDLSGSIALNGFKVYGMDSTTNDYTCDLMGYFNCTDENGNAIVPEALFTMEDAKRYMTIETENGYTFHRLFLGITKISLAPNDTGFGYKAEFYGDEMVQSKIASIGYNLWMTQDVVVSRTTAFKNTLTLRIRNFDVVNYGQTPVNACVTMTLTDGTVIESGTVTYSLRQVVEQLNESATDLYEEKRSAVATMIANNPTMQFWLVENIYKKS